MEVTPKELLHTVSKDPDNALRTDQVGGRHNQYLDAGKEKFRKHKIDENIVHKFTLEKLLVLKAHLDKL